MSRVPDDLTKAVHEFVYNRGLETESKARKERARDKLKRFLTVKEDGEFVNGREDENGHRYLDLESAIPDGDDLIESIRATRNVSSSIDLDLCADVLQSRGLYDRVFKRVVIRQFDEHELYALNQQGLISDEELDSMITEAITYSLTAVRS